jgi:hypothetical protein
MRWRLQCAPEKLIQMVRVCSAAVCVIKWSCVSLGVCVVASIGMRLSLCHRCLCVRWWACTCVCVCVVCACVPVCLCICVRMGGFHGSDAVSGQLSVTLPRATEAIVFYRLAVKHFTSIGLFRKSATVCLAIG